MSGERRTRLAAWSAPLLVALLTTLGARGSEAQEVTHERVAGSVWRIDGAIDVLVAQSGEDGLLLVDSGYPFAEAGVRSALRRIAGTDRPARLVNTHAHHAFSNHLYGAGSEIVAHENAARRLASGFLMAGTVVGAAPVAGRPEVVFADSARFRMNGEEISLVHLPGAHTDGDAVVIFHGSNVVAAGDLVVPHMPWISVDEGGSVDGLLAGLDRLLEIVPEDTRIVPGHDPVTLSKDDVRSFRAMIAQAADTVRARLEAGMSLRRIQTLGLPGLADWRGAVPEALFIESLVRSFAEARPTPSAPALELVNGRWWDGAGFTPRTVYAVEGILRFEPPAEGVDRTIDLADGFVVPPAGEAHTHRLSDPATLEDDAATFLSDGVFYAMVQDPAVELGPIHRELSDRIDAPDVAYTQGVVTPSWGVIVDFYRMLAGSGRFAEGATVDDLDGRVLFRIDTVDDLEAAWPALEAENDRFVKVILAFSEEIGKRRADPSAYGADLPRSSAKAGVTGEVLDALVTRAHEAGLEVSAHIETAADFRRAVEAGVDWVAHMPASWQVGSGTGFGAGELEPWLLTVEDGFAARRAGTIVVTTVAPDEEDPRAATFRRIHAHNLEVLVEAGAALAIGSDSFTGSVVDEALYLRELGALSDAQLFRLVAVQTPRSIFPERRIGHLRDGWEASFLVLGSDPTRDVSALRDVRIRVKRGVVLP